MVEAGRVQDEVGFFSVRERKELEAAARTRKADWLDGVRAPAILDMDGGMAAADVAKVLRVGENAVRAWRGSVKPCCRIMNGRGRRKESPTRRVRNI